MGFIVPGYYTQNGVKFHIRERGERTLLEIYGEEFEFNANGYLIAQATEEMRSPDEVELDPDDPCPDPDDMDPDKPYTFKSTFAHNGRPADRSTGDK